MAFKCVVPCVPDFFQSELSTRLESGVSQAFHLCGPTKVTYMCRCE